MSTAKSNRGAIGFGILLLFIAALCYSIIMHEFGMMNTKKLDCLMCNGNRSKGLLCTTCMADSTVTLLINCFLGVLKIIIL